MAADRLALVALYNATDGANWTDNTNWKDDNAALGSWDGVSVDGNGRVTVLRLKGNTLSGEIPAELGNLGNLLELYLNDNQLTGEIPSWLVRLTELKELSLWGNH